MVASFAVKGIGIVCEACALHFYRQHWPLKRTSGRGLQSRPCDACNGPLLRRIVRWNEADIKVKVRR